MQDASICARAQAREAVDEAGTTGDGTNVWYHLQSSTCTFYDAFALPPAQCYVCGEWLPACVRYVFVRMQENGTLANCCGRGKCYELYVAETAPLKPYLPFP